MRKQRSASSPMPLQKTKSWKDKTLLRRWHFRLADLPPEIRILIFTEYLEWEIRRDAEFAKLYEKDKGSKTPQLIKALRPDMKMYTEALDVYFDLATFTVSSNNKAQFKYMRQETLERVRSLEIWYGFTISKYAWKLELSPCFPAKLLFRCTNVHQICLTTTATTLPGSEWTTTLRDLVKQVIVQLPRLQILTLNVPRPRSDERRGNDRLMIERIKSLTLFCDRCIGLEHVKIRKGIFNWNAGKGRTLTWTDGQYWRSIPWGNVNQFYVHLTGFHNLCFWGPLQLHFLGLNPRPFFFTCAAEKCVCMRPGQDWRFVPPRDLGLVAVYDSVGLYEPAEEKREEM